MRRLIIVAMIIFFGIQASNAETALMGALRSSVPASVSEGLIVPEVHEDRSATGPGPDWVALPAGSFLMGARDSGEAFGDAVPAHVVSLKAFEMSRTDVTVEQYAACVSAGRCAAPATGGNCNWGKPGRQQHPVNCVSWEQAARYAVFAGARLPTEAEWEYAATSGGRDRKYSWGGQDPACGLAVMGGCYTEGTLPVCSRPAGNTAQGLCDMAGNVWQWTQDKYIGSYAGAPADGSAFETAGQARVTRGGSFDNGDFRLLQTVFRHGMVPGTRDARVGFRVAR